MRRGGNDTKRHSWKDVGVVALPCVVSLAVVSHRREGRAGTEHAFTLENREVAYKLSESTLNKTLRLHFYDKQTIVHFRMTDLTFV